MFVDVAKLIYDLMVFDMALREDVEVSNRAVSAQLLASTFVQSLSKLYPDAAQDAYCMFHLHRDEYYQDIVFDYE